MSSTETPLYTWKFTWEGGEVELVKGTELVLPGAYGSRITVYGLVGERRVAVKSAKSDVVLDVALVEDDEQDDDGPTVVSVGIATLPDVLRHLFDATKCNDPECPRCVPSDEASDASEEPKADSADVPAEPEPEVSKDAVTPPYEDQPYGARDFGHPYR